MSEFKVGDRVRIVAQYEGTAVNIGRCGELVDYREGFDCWWLVLLDGDAVVSPWWPEEFERVES